MSDESLFRVQEQAYRQFGMKVDVYHSERDRIVYVLQHGAPVHPSYIIQVMQY